MNLVVKTAAKVVFETGYYVGLFTFRRQHRAPSKCSMVSITAHPPSNLHMSTIMLFQEW